MGNASAFLRFTPPRQVRPSSSRILKFIEIDLFSKSKYRNEPCSWHFKKRIMVDARQSTTHIASAALQLSNIDFRRRIEQVQWLQNDT